MTREQEAQYQEFEQFFKAFNVKAFIKAEDASYGLPESEKHFKELISWIRKFFRNKKYSQEIPLAQTTAILNTIHDAKRTIENIDQIRQTDPTAFIQNRSSYVNELENRYGDLYRDLINPLRSYLALERGGLADITKTAEESIENIRQSEQALEDVESAKREATADESASENAMHFQSLADTYHRSKKFWFAGIFVYMFLFGGIVFHVYVNSDTIRNALASFDTKNVPAYVLKVFVLALFAYGLNFISRNYNARLMLAIAAETRATRLKTWRAFLSAPELNQPESAIIQAKADIASDVAKVLFSDMPTGLEHGRSKVLEAPINITNKK